MEPRIESSKSMTDDFFRLLLLIQHEIITAPTWARPLLISRMATTHSRKGLGRSVNYELVCCLVRNLMESSCSDLLGQDLNDQTLVK